MRIFLIPLWTKTGTMFLLRSGRSAIMLCLMAVAAVSSLIFLSSLDVGVNDAMIRNSVGMFSGHISGFSLPKSITPEALKIEGVKEVLRRVYVPGTISRGANTESLNLAGVDPDKEEAVTALSKKKIKGEFIQSGEPGIYLSRFMSERLNATLADEVIFKAGYGEEIIRLRVAGIYSTGVEELDSKTAFVPLNILPDSFIKTWLAGIFLNEGVSPELVLNEYHRQFPSIKFMTWKDLMPDLLQLIDLNYVSMNIVMFLVFGVVSIGIACAFAIFILKNMREYGIMKSMGVTPGEVGYLIMIEIFLINIAASVAGVIIGLTAVYIVSGSGIDLTAFTSHNRYFAVSGVIYPRLTFYSLALPPLLALIFSLLSGIWPAMIVSRKKAVQILKG
ncbi:MAG: ABC transporter permease [Deltaproteobacteria bacterium]|nr:ABC transporter permease [Deltaproteobacteria bacterium]